MLKWSPSELSFKKIRGEAVHKTEYISELVVSNNGTIWAGGRNGLYWTGTSGSPSENPTLIKYRGIEEVVDVSALMVDNAGNVYVAYGLSLYKIPKASNHAEKVVWDDSTISNSDRITALAENTDEIIYIGTDAGQVV